MTHMYMCGLYTHSGNMTHAYIHMRTAYDLQAWIWTALDLHIYLQIKYDYASFI